VRVTNDDRTSRHGVVVYRSTSTAFASEKVLQTAGFQVRIIPVPRSISTDCCLGLRIRWEEHQLVQEMLRSEGIEFVDMFPWPP